MNPEVNLLKLTLCGPNDVVKEIAIAQEIVTEWNVTQGEKSGFWIKHQHWSTDTHPDLSDRPQGVINRQVIDDSDLLVAIFWSRFGMPTSVAGSGTEEEIQRGVRLGKKVMVYFSDLEPLPATAQQAQIERLAEFRRGLLTEGLCGRFSSRDQFRKLFRLHLAHAVNELRPPPPVPKSASNHQSIHGDHNIQVGGDVHLHAKPLVVKKVIARRENSLTPDECVSVQRMIEQVVEGTAGMLRARAFGMWWQRFKNHFSVEKYEELASARMVDVEAWFVQQRAIQTRGLKTKAPDQWRDRRIGAIKKAMERMGMDKANYYPEIANRLKMKRPFASLNDLTKTDLDRVYTMVLRDAAQ
ncbi:MAG: hypothetical protein ABIR80_15905 [Opitutaceae bacterium]